MEGGRADQFAACQLWPEFKYSCSSQAATTLKQAIGAATNKLRLLSLVPNCSKYFFMIAVVVELRKIVSIVDFFLFRSCHVWLEYFDRANN